MEEDGK